MAIGCPKSFARRSNISRKSIMLVVIVFYLVAVTSILFSQAAFPQEVSGWPAATDALISAVGLHRVWDRAVDVMASEVAPAK